MVDDGLLHGAQVTGPGLGQADRFVAGGRLERPEVADRALGEGSAWVTADWPSVSAWPRASPGEGLAVGRGRDRSRAPRWPVASVARVAP